MAGPGIMKDIKHLAIGIGVAGIVIVLMNVILVTFKGLSVTTAAINTTIDTVLTAINSPVTYFGIIVLVVIFVYLLKLMTKIGGKGSD